MIKKLGALALLGVALSMSAPADAEAGRLKNALKSKVKDAAFAVVWTGSCAADKILKGKKGAFASVQFEGPCSILAPRLSKDAAALD